MPSVQFTITPSVCRSWSSTNKESFDIVYGNGRAITCKNAEQVGEMMTSLTKAHVEEVSQTSGKMITDDRLFIEAVVAVEIATGCPKYQAEAVVRAMGLLLNRPPS